jgi:P27 family predicted phage terminase small subunit
MTPRGRKPLPTSLKKLRGTWRPDRASGTEPQVESAIPEPPDWLSADALAEWKRLAPQLAAAGLLTKLDRAALASYCSAWGDLCEANRTLQQFGSTYITERGVIVLHPMLKVVERSRHALRAFASEFGLSPSARTRVDAKSVPVDDEDEARRRRFFPALARGGRA